MSVKFVEVDRETLYLLPPSLQDLLPEGHLARFVVEIVEQLDLRSLKEAYAGKGSQPYNRSSSGIWWPPCTFFSYVEVSIAGIGI